MTDLSQLLGPGTAALWAGQNQRLEQEKSMADAERVKMEIEKLRQRQAFDSQQNPLLLEQQRLTNAGLEAGLPGITADAASKGIDVRKKKATFDSDVYREQLDNLFKGDEARAKRTKMFGDTFVSFAPLLAQIPDAPGARINALKSLMQQAGIPVDGEAGRAFASVLANTPTAQLPETLQRMGTNMVEMSAPYLQATGVAKINKEAQEQIAAGNNATQIKVANIQAEARKAAASGKAKAVDIVEQVKAGKLSFEKAAVAFDVMAAMSDDPEEKAKYQDLAQRYEAANLAPKTAGQTGKVDLDAQGIPTTQPKLALTSPQGNKPTPKVNSLADVQKMYPGVPADKLREAYKNKFGVELK